MSNYMLDIGGGDKIIFSDENYRHKAIEFLESLNKAVKGELHIEDVPFILIKYVEQRRTAFELGVLTKNAEEKYIAAKGKQKLVMNDLNDPGSSEENFSLNQYVRDACRTECEYDYDLSGRLTESAGILHGIIGLQTEIGELSDAVKRFIFYGKDLDKTNVGEEIGDIMWYLAILCKSCGLNFEEILKKNIHKLKVRYPEKFTEEAAINRNLEKEREVL